jgi:amino acid adenylation domain-containing protein
MEALNSERSRKFWEEVLEGVEPGRLPRSGGASGEGASGGGKRALLETLPDEVVKGLQEVGQKAGVPLKSVLLAAHVKVQSILCGRRDVITGVATHGRPESEDGEQVLGLFLNSMPLRAQLEPGSWRELARRMFEREQAMMPHRRYPMETLQQGRGGEALFETLYNYTHFHVQEGEQMKRVLSRGGAAETNFPMVVSFQVPANEGETFLLIEVSPEVVGEKESERVVRLYRQVLEAMAARPDSRHEAEDYLSEEEREAVKEWERGEKREYEEVGVGELLEEVERNAERGEVAVREVGGRELSYQELGDRSGRLAAYLRELGVKSGRRVGLCVGRSLELIEGMVGIVKAGGVYVPLDTEYPEERLREMVADAGVELVVTVSEQVKRMGWLAEGGVGRVVVLDRDREEIGKRERLQVGGVGGDEAMYVMYTSGSTGKAKGVEIRHRGVVRLVRNSNYIELGKGERVLQMAPVSFDASTLEIWGALLNGGRLVLMREGTPTLEEIAGVLKRERISVLWLTAPLFQMMTETHGEELSGVRQVLAGGDVLSVEAVRRHVRRMGEGQWLVNGYGPTENTTFTSCHRMDRNWELKRTGTVPVGKPVANTTVRIVDEWMNRCGVGRVGELVTGGDGVGLGYVGRPDWTAERFVPDPEGEPGSRMYRTGDRGKWSGEGWIEFEGRKDGQVKIRGYRIEVGEVEAALKAIEGVVEAAVVVVGEGESKHLVGCVVSRGEAAGVGAWQEELGKRLPEYMRPARWIWMDALPLTVSGKVDRRKLAREASGTAGIGKESVGYVAPRTEWEARIAGIWGEVLGVSGPVGVEDGFFEQGGHSLMAMRITARIREELGIELPLRAIFECPTVAQLAARVQQASPDGSGKRKIRRIARVKQSAQ